MMRALDEVLISFRTIAEELAERLAAVGRSL